MGVFEQFPYANMHEMNLDWLLKKMKELDQAMETFKATESLKFADPIIWDITTQYQKSTIVLDPTGNAYLSLQPVPAGVQLNNDEYWLEIFNFTDYTRTANQNLTVNTETNTTRATADYQVDDWLIWNDVLYRVTAPIAIDDALIVAPDAGSNIVHFTVEDFIKAFITYATGLINQYKNDIDASELAYRQQLAQDVADTTASLQAQLDAAISGATVDSEVINARVGWDNTTYSTLRESITTQIKNVVDNNVVLSNFPTLDWTLNRNVDATGAVVTNNYTAITILVKAEANDIIIRRTPASDGTWLLLFYVNEYDKNQAWIKRTELLVNESLTLDTNTSYVRFAFGRGSGSGIPIQNSDIALFDSEFYRKSALNCNSQVFRGRVTDYGTSIAECLDDGYYRFTTGDLPSISDFPDGWSSGGIVKTFVFNPSTRWQFIEGQEGVYCRYGSGSWYNLASDNIFVNYNPNSGNDSSTEQLDVYIPRVNSIGDSIRYNMGHCVDNTINCDTWRIMYSYKVSGNTPTVLTRHGEWECALHLDGAPDFMGGYTHGDEVEISIQAFKDGKPTAISSLSGTCKELKIVRTSILYNPSDHVTQVAKHGVEYIYTYEGLTIKQSIEWLLPEALTACYLAMLPILKTYSTYSYSDVGYDIITNSASNYDIPIPDAKSVTEFATAENYNFTMAIDEYPTGYTGGDCAIITDNNGLSYNKIYFVVCTSASVNAGDVWKSKTIYNHK